MHNEHIYTKKKNLEHLKTENLLSWIILRCELFMETLQRILLDCLVTYRDLNLKFGGLN